MRTRRGVRGGNVLEFKRQKVVDELDKLDGKILKTTRILQTHYLTIHPEPPRRKYERRATSDRFKPLPAPAAPRPMQTVPLYVTLPDPIYVGMPVGARIPDGCPGAGDFFTFTVQEGWQAGQSVMIPLQVIDPKPPSPPPPPPRREASPVKEVVPPKEDIYADEAEAVRKCQKKMQELKELTVEICNCVQRGPAVDSDTDEWEALLCLELDDLLSDLRNMVIEGGLQPTAYSLQPTAYSLQPTAYSLRLQPIANSDRRCTSDSRSS